MATEHEVMFEFIKLLSGMTERQKETTLELIHFVVKARRK